MKNFATMHRKTPRSKRSKSRGYADDGQARAAWAMLLNANPNAIARATQRLHDTLMDGLRHFSAIRRAVPLEQAVETHKEIVAAERTTDPTEIFTDRERRVWRRRSSLHLR